MKKFKYNKKICWVYNNFFVNVCFFEIILESYIQIQFRFKESMRLIINFKRIYQFKGLGCFKDMFIM